MNAALKLLRWYDKNGRDLPWRRTRDPYKILVSEIMLQQTQVSRGLIFYARWLKRFPDWKTLAAASNADVIKEWAGLGYNRRALMLRDIAKQIVAQGEPSTEDGWRALKGIGPYTAAAISAFAQKKRTLPIDTNIRRVLARLLLGIPYPSLKTDERIKKKTDAFLPKTGRYYDVPQAIFDLSTSICTKYPDCAKCPLREQCLAAPKFLSGSINPPRATIKKAVESKHRDKKHPDRIYRGRILKLVRESGSISLDKVGAVIDETFSQKLDHVWITAMIDRLVKDHLILRKNNKLSLE